MGWCLLSSTTLSASATTCRSAPPLECLLPAIIRTGPSCSSAPASASRPCLTSPDTLGSKLLSLCTWTRTRGVARPQDLLRHSAVLSSADPLHGRREGRSLGRCDRHEGDARERRVDEGSLLPVRSLGLRGGRQEGAGRGGCLARVHREVGPRAIIAMQRKDSMNECVCRECVYAENVYMQRMHMHAVHIWAQNECMHACINI